MGYVFRVYYNRQPRLWQLLSAENSPAGRKFIRSAYAEVRDLLYQAVGDPREFGRRNAEFRVASLRFEVL